MPEHTVGTREEFEAAHAELLEREKEHTRQADAIAEQRRELPWVRIDKDYRFETAGGERSFADLFDGRSQLLIYHFMYGPAYEAGCPACSSIADTIDGITAHLAAKDVTMICASRAPIDRLLAFRERMGWSFDWVSHTDDFGFDFGFSHTDEEIQSFIEGVPAIVGEPAAMCGTDVAGYLTESPGLMAFALDDGTVYHTYTAANRGVEVVMGYYPVLDRAPLGRNEGPEFWLRRHDENGTP
jgi:predicted dithiol-disulfide oxidoreductase (DUF899 family)